VSKDLFIVQSYTQIGNLSLFLKYSNRKKDILIIGKKELFNYLSDLNKSYGYFGSIDFIESAHIPKILSFELFSFYFKIKKKVNTLKSNSYSDIYFSSLEFGDIIGLVIRSLNSARVIHIPDPNCRHYSFTQIRFNFSKYYLKNLIFKLVFRNTMELNFVKPRLNNTKIVSRLSRKLIKNRDIIINQYSYWDNEHSLNNFSFPKTSFPTIKNKIIFVLKEMVESGLVNETEYIYIIRNVLNILSIKYGKDSILYKNKPGKTTSQSNKLFQNFLEIPNYIPFEHIELDNNSLIIGFTSTSLTKTEVKTISLAKMFQFIDEESIKRSIDIQEKRASRKVIFYPKNLQEFQTIINEH
jgi:hypothetical protein